MRGRQATGTSLGALMVIRAFAQLHSPPPVHHLPDAPTGLFPTLGVRIYIPDFHVENSRLSDSEIALGSQLKKEGKVTAHHS